MKKGIIFILVFLFTISWAFAEKAAPIQYDPADYPAPTRQGGETIVNATIIEALPYNDTGTTTGYVNDYDEVCPYAGSTSPDVVYSYTPTVNVINGIVTTCNMASYDTKLYIYENTVTPGAPFACNDDYTGCAGFSSQLEGLTFTAGNTYYIVVDGYGGASGNYEINVTGEIAGTPIITVNPLSINETLDPDDMLTVPVTIENSGTGNLTYIISITETTDVTDRQPSVKFISANNMDNVEVDPNANGACNPQLTDEMWDVQFAYDVNTSSGLDGLAGAETDGTFYYVTKWASNEIVKFDLEGNYIETFSIGGVTGLRDLAYDGMHFYGSNASSYIWQMDFNDHTLINTITTPAPVRAIAYNSDLDAFWYNNFSTDLHLVDRTGALLNTIMTPPSMYGCAYDNITAGGPYLWIYTGTAAGGGSQIEQYDLNILALTGLTHDVSADLGAVIAGGLFLESNLITGTVTLGGLGQSTPDVLFGYEIGNADELWLTASPLSGTIPAGASVDIDVTLNATDLIDITKTANVLINNNAGDTVVLDVTMIVTGEVMVVEPPQNLMVTDEGYATWEAPNAGDEFIGYNVYLDDEFIVFTTDLFYQYTELSTGITYLAEITALYDEGESDPISYSFINPEDTFDAPSNLLATVVDYNDVELTWEAPSGAAEWMRWDSAENGDAIGLNDGGTFYSASHWNPSDLTEFDGAEISKIEFFPNTDSDFVIKIWTGANAGTLVTSEVVTSPTVGSFQEVILSTPVIIDASMELWFGYEVTHVIGDYPAGTDFGPAVVGLGDMISMDGIEWEEMSGLGLDYNWNLAAYVAGSDGEAIVLSKPHKAVKAVSKSLLSERSPFSSMPISHSRESRSLSGYKIYRDGSEIVEISDPTTLTYTDESLDAGTYEYTIVAFYTNPEGESDSVGPIVANIVLNPPSNVAANSQPPNIIVTWGAPERDISSYNVYRDGVEINSGNTSNMLIDIAVPAGTYLYSVEAVYDGGWTVMSSDYEVTHVAGDDILKPTVTELTGNYPNPFNPTTTISFSLKEAGHVSIDIYNMRGQLVKTLINAELDSNFHNIVWDGKDNSGKNISSGVYFYKMKAQNYNSTKRMILMK